MSALRLHSHPKIASILAIHGVTFSLTIGAIGLLAWFDLRNGVSPWIVILVGAAVLSISSLMLFWQLQGAYFWDQMLARLIDEPADPFSLPLCPQPSLAAQGWNRFLALGRQWQSLSELETSVSKRLNDESSGKTTDDVLNGLADGLVVVELDGTISRTNHLFAAICGANSSQDLVGKTLSQALGVPAGAQHQLDEMGTKKHLAIDVQLPGAEGQSRMLRCIRRPRLSDAHQLTGHVWTIRDVTQQRLAESMRERFLTTATHEFRTPLANIRAYAEALEMSAEVDPESRKNFYNIIQTESVRLAQLIDDLLDISRMQAGAMALERHETDLGRLAEEATAKVNAQMQAKNLQFRCEFPPKFPKAHVDKSKLTAAIVNMLGNAAKYTPEGGKVMFRVEVGPTQAHFIVVDSGIGITPEELPRVFDRFFRSNDDRVREITGSGLGLSLTQEVARLHGGDVIVESVLNQGSTFRLTIPIDAVAN